MLVSWCGRCQRAEVVRAVGKSAAQAHRMHAAKSLLQIWHLEGKWSKVEHVDMPRVRVWLLSEVCRAYVDRWGSVCVQPMVHRGVTCAR